jgi:hypothetical protein
MAKQTFAQAKAAAAKAWPSKNKVRLSFLKHTPKRSGSAAALRHAQYKNQTSLSAAKASGLHKGDFLHDVFHGYVEVSATQDVSQDSLSLATLPPVGLGGAAPENVAMCALHGYTCASNAFAGASLRFEPLEAMAKLVVEVCNKAYCRGGMIMNKTLRVYAASLEVAAKFHRCLKRDAIHAAACVQLAIGLEGESVLGFFALSEEESASYKSFADISLARVATNATAMQGTPVTPAVVSRHMCGLLESWP